jgi:hypothetical protein
MADPYIPIRKESGDERSGSGAVIRGATFRSQMRYAPLSMAPLSARCPATICSRSWYGARARRAGRAILGARLPGGAGRWSSLAVTADTQRDIAGTARCLGRRAGPDLGNRPVSRAGRRGCGCCNRALRAEVVFGKIHYRHSHDGDLGTRANAGRG